MLIGWLNPIIGISIGFATGGNDAANAMGAAVGAGVRTIRQAVMLVAFFGFIGALIQGGKVVHNIDSTVISLTSAPPSLGNMIITISYLASALWVFITTFRGLPTSTSQAIIGALVGSAYALDYQLINWNEVALLVTLWLLTPIMSCSLAYVIGIIFRLVKLKENRYNRLWSVLLTLSGIYMAYSWGASDVVAAATPIVISGTCNTKIAIIFGGLAMSLGVLSWSHKVMKTVGSKITDLIPSRAFAAQISASICIHTCATLGFPGSTSHAIVSAITGIGLSRSSRAVSKRFLARIILLWLFTPVATFLMSYLISYMFKII